MLRVEFWAGSTYLCVVGRSTRAADPAPTRPSQSHTATYRPENRRHRPAHPPPELQPRTPVN